MSKSLKVPLSRPQIPEPLLPPRIKSQQRQITLQRALLQALLDKRYEDAESFIHKGADVNSRGDIGHLLLQNGEALLHRAAHRQNTGMAKFLLEHGAEIEAVDKLEATPLIVAAKHGLLSMTKFLVEHDAAVETRDVFGRTALSYAASDVPTHGGRHLILGIVLIRQGAEPNTQNNLGYTPLHHATAAGWNTRNVIDLLEAGAEVDVRTNTGLTAFDIALRSGEKEIARIYIENEQTFRPKYHEAACPLVEACAKGDIVYCRYLLWKSVWVGPKYEHNASGWSSKELALVVASQPMRYDIVETLMEIEFEDHDPPRTNITHNGMTLMHHAISNKDLRMLDIWLGFDSSDTLNVFEIRDSSGLTSLLYALRNRNVPAAKRLILYHRCRRGGLTSCDGTVSPIALIFDIGDKRLLYALESRGIWDSEAYEITHEEVLKASNKTIDLLYETTHGLLDIKANALSQTSIHKAAAAGHKYLTEVLLRSKTIANDDVVKQDKEGQTAHDLAVQAGIEDVARMIKKHMPPENYIVATASPQITVSGGPNLVSSNQSGSSTSIS
jgi:ankyrin repeat protein